MERIIKRMRELYPVSDEAVELFADSLERKIIPPKTIIIEAGKADRNVYFIERGVTRSFSLFNGREVTIRYGGCLFIPRFLVSGFPQSHK